MTEKKRSLGCLAVAAPFVVAAWVFMAVVAYVVVVTILRYAFGIELWNPFN